VKSLFEVSQRAARAAERVPYADPVRVVYNPVAYASAPHRAYLDRFGVNKKRVFLLGMNPGPWGMAQTGVPFGEVGLVKNWMGISGAVKQPKAPHPKVPVRGFDCPRSEGSGKRLWGWAQKRGNADWFFSRFFVWNYAPLCFLAESGANITPDKLKPRERAELLAICDRALAEVIGVLEPTAFVGIGNFAASRLAQVVGDRAPIEKLLHPSPANPRANAGWEQEAERVLGRWL
jgi:single-strand selective monofunctional uracil DNA glycosylase